ncbi:MAG: UbiA family prenyltransferase [Caldisphaeraceae archaeon]|nr:UbiA family prenyltransferase [Caldisphaeraceae archaeon]MEB3692240.1 UbiA family prenyltransferase [Caldisphaeraceae archaeon]MEB3797797.1 UbiA family prenyltransferase [Caldisphaeraceae archaeon]
MTKKYVSLVRPINDAMIGLSVIVGAFIASGRIIPNLLNLGFGFITGFFISGSAMILNDIIDLDIDAINNPLRPLPSKAISIKSAKILFVIFSVIGLTFSLLSGILTFAIAMASYIIAIIYNTKGKKTGIPGNLMVAYAMGVPIIYGSAIVGRLNFNIFIYWLMIFLSGIAREITKGITDIEGDRRAGIKTLAVTKGPRAAALASLLLYISAIALSPIPIITGKVYPILYLIPISIVDAMFLGASALTLILPKKESAYKSKNISLLAMLIGLLGFLISTKP